MVMRMIEYYGGEIDWKRIGDVRSGFVGGMTSEGIYH